MIYFSFSLLNLLGGCKSRLLLLLICKVKIELNSILDTSITFVFFRSQLKALFVTFLFLVLERLLCIFGCLQQFLDFKIDFINVRNSTVAIYFFKLFLDAQRKLFISAVAFFSFASEGICLYFLSAKT
jgi:hypothetical protein